MASTNKTANLNLNQWAAGDPVLREDFNADNAAIDAAMGDLPVQKIREVTTAQAAEAVEFDLSDIDLDKYAELHFVLFLRAAESGPMYQTYAYFNVAGTEANTKTVYRYPEDSNHCPTYNQPLEGMIPRYTTDPPTVWDIRMTLSPANSSQFRVYIGTSQAVMTSNESPYMLYRFFSMWSNRLNKLILKKEYAHSEYPTSSMLIGVGSKLIIYGVKK